MRRPRPRHLLRDFRPRYAALLKVPGQRGRQAVGDAVSIHAPLRKYARNGGIRFHPAQKNIFAFAPGYADLEGRVFSLI